MRWCPDATLASSYRLPKQSLGDDHVLAPGVPEDVVGAVAGRRHVVSHRDLVRRIRDVWRIHAALPATPAGYIAGGVPELRRYDVHAAARVDLAAGGDRIGAAKEVLSAGNSPNRPSAPVS